MCRGLEEGERGRRNVGKQDRVYGSREKCRGMIDWHHAIHFSSLISAFSGLVCVAISLRMALVLV